MTLTFSLGWAFGQCPSLLKGFVEDMFPGVNGTEVNGIHLQQHHPGAGYTDIESRARISTASSSLSVAGLCPRSSNSTNPPAASIVTSVGVHWRPSPTPAGRQRLHAAVVGRLAPATDRHERDAQ